VTAVAAVAALVAAWRSGSSPETTAAREVHVVSPPPTTLTRAAAARPTTGPSRGRPTPAPPAHQVLDGAVVATPYGDVQVRAVLDSHHLSDVRALHLTDANNTSRRISAGAAPTLRSEALAAQSAQIDTVSGATYTSEGYRQSLQAALDAVHR
jgi:uncharacterized protein with FMN-binding domain